MPLIPHMRRYNLWMAANVSWIDSSTVTWGMAELARFFLVAERLEPPGTIFDHCQPRNLTGLYTYNKPHPMHYAFRFPEGVSEGW